MLLTDGNNDLVSSLNTTKSEIGLDVIEDESIDLQKVAESTNGRNSNEGQECKKNSQDYTDNPQPTQSDVAEHKYYTGISQLLPSLYICGASAAIPNVLDQIGIKFIINVSPELPDTPLSSVTTPLYLRVNILDRPDVDFISHFDEVADMIEEVRQNGGKTLVHCVAGVSRSATLCIAYLMKHSGMSLRMSYNHVKSIRPQIRPNTGFFEQLRTYEERLCGTCSVKMIYYKSLGKEIPDVYEPEYKAMEEYYHRRLKKVLRPY